MSDQDKTTLRRLAEATAALLLQRERRTLRALVRAERRTAAMLEHAVRPHIERATLSVAHAPAYDQQRVALATIRRTAPGLQRALEGALTEARGYARTAGRDLLASAFAVASPAPLSGRDEHDAAAAHSASSSWSAAWASAATALVLSEDDPARAPETAARARAPGLGRIAATETASAFNDERRRAFDDLAKSSLAPELFRVWSAVLDRKTCAFCFGKDGQVRALHESFGASPPVHPNCRCIIELVRVPRPERLEDISIDYASFKAEVRDVIRERREESGRHAAAFITDSMGARSRSPLVLTGRFTRKPYVAR
jgi:hypothetical protein